MITQLLISIKKKVANVVLIPFMSIAKFCKYNSFYWGRKQHKLSSICGLFPAPKMGRSHRPCSLPQAFSSLSYLAGSSGSFPGRFNSYSAEKKCVKVKFTHRDFCFAQQAVSGTESRSRCSLYYWPKKVLPLPAPLTNGFLTASFRKQAMQKRSKTHCFCCPAVRAEKEKCLL